MSAMLDKPSLKQLAKESSEFADDVAGMGLLNDKGEFTEAEQTAKVRQKFSERLDRMQALLPKDEA